MLIFVVFTVQSVANFFQTIGEIVKIRNNLKEFSPTEALYVSRVQGCEFLFCVGSDVDNGDGFTNGRNFCR